MTKTFSTLALILIILALCGTYLYYNGYFQKESELVVIIPEDIDVEEPPRKLVFVDDYLNGSYLVGNNEYQLTEGKFENEITEESALKEVVKIVGNPIKKDLNSDGKEDYVFLITDNFAGSGLYYFVTSAISRNDKFFGTNSVLLGNMISPTTLKIVENEIVVNYLDRELTDLPSKKPYVQRVKTIILNDEELEEKTPVSVEDSSATSTEGSL